MREKIIEQKFRAAVRAAGGVAVKFVSPGLDGMPDRLALLPGGRMAFVEVKAPGKKPRPLQEARHLSLIHILKSHRASPSLCHCPISGSL